MLASYSESKNNEVESRSWLKSLSNDIEDDESAEGESDNDENQEQSDEEEDDDDYELIIDFNDLWISDFLDNFNKTFRFPKLKIIRIDHLGTFNLDMRTLWKTTITSWDELYINQKCLPKDSITKVDISSYLDSVVEVIPKITETLLIGYFALNSIQMSLIMKSATNIQLLSFNWCKIHVDKELDFGEKPSQIRTLAFTGWGKGFNGGMLDLDSMKSIIQAISDSGVKECLKHLSLTWWNLSSETITELLEVYNLEKVMVSPQVSAEPKTSSLP